MKDAKREKRTHRKTMALCSKSGESKLIHTNVKVVNPYSKYIKK